MDDTVILDVQEPEPPVEARLDEEKKDKRPKRKKAAPKADVTVLEYYGEDEEELREQIEKTVAGAKMVSFVSMPKQLARPELVIWIRDHLGVETNPLNIHSNLHIKDHDARRRGGWVCHLV